uniref:Pyridoxal biosynthesis lyase pdxS n=2 Tax=Lygus hesperus TaxID=30085 RepID=A0A0A9XI15_LYGHE
MYKHVETHCVLRVRDQLMVFESRKVGISMGAQQDLKFQYSVCFAEGKRCQAEKLFTGEALYSGDNIELSSTSNIQRSYSTLKELKTTLEGMSSSDVDFLPEDMEGFEHNDNPPSEEDSQTPHLISKQKRKIACPFCGQEVMNFTRHLLRQHEKEEFVKEIKELTPNHNRIKYLKRLDSAEALAELNQIKQQILFYFFM